MSAPSAIVIRGLGAVSPAGWGVASLRQALEKNEPIPSQPLARPGWNVPLRIRAVPAPAVRPAFFSHARLRRVSPISQFAVAAALEALGLGNEVATTQEGQNRDRMGIIFCVMDGCVNYSRRFYDETLKDPSTASPLVFPETVFNAPASHLAALLGIRGINYTLVGDPGVFLQGLAMAANWIEEGTVDSCLVVGAEEKDWLTADAARLFRSSMILGEGGGAMLLERGGSDSTFVQLQAVTDSFLFAAGQSRQEAAHKMRQQLKESPKDGLLCSSEQNLSSYDDAERRCWEDWTGKRLAPKAILGEGLVACAAWQCVAAVDLLQRGACKNAAVSVVGTNQQAIGARFSV